MDSPEKPIAKPTGMLHGLSPAGLLDGVLGGSGGDWEPPEADEVEPWFSGYAGFAFIDRGSMGAVYAATQLSLDRRVAIKILPPELGLNPDFVARFQREARLLAKLQHPNIIAVHDSGTTENGHAFIAMEFVQGTCLLDILRERPIPLTEALEISAQVAQALAFAHEHGVIHRDIKPTNILIDEWGRARVADFGLAKLVGQDWFDVAAFGGTGAGLGTPGYAAPEQKRSDPQVDQRTDIFSLGVTLRELVTGEVSDDPDDLSDLAATACPKFVTQIILKAIRENPQHRYQSASDLEADLTSALKRASAPTLPIQIFQRPITAMVIGIQLVVTGWLLYEKVQAEWLSPPRTSAQRSPTIIPVDQTHYAILAEPLTWPDAQAFLDRHNAFTLANPPDEEILKRLHEMGIRSPLWVHPSDSTVLRLVDPEHLTSLLDPDPATEAWTLIHQPDPSPAK